MKINNDKFYVIRHKPTGLIKAGGQNANFNKTGKLWLGARVKMHLRQFCDRWSERRYGKRDRVTLINEIWDGPYTNFPVDECEIVELELKEIKTHPLRQFVEEEMKE